MDRNLPYRFLRGQPLNTVPKEKQKKKERKIGADY